MYSDIIQHFVKPFARNNYDENLKIHQDNATTHFGRAKIVLEEIGVQWVIVQVYSPLKYKIFYFLKDEITSKFPRSKSNRVGVARP